MSEKNDSIERVLDDASKAPLAYWNCKDHECSNCPSIAVNAECAMAQRIDLVNRTRALFKRQLPEGVEWPRFEDGELVRIGDEVEFHDGEIEKVLQVFTGCDGYTLYGETKEEFSEYGTPVDRPEPEDTQEKIDADAEKDFCVYFGWGGKQCDDDGGCPAFAVGDCRSIMIRDLLRRQRELCERGAR